MYIQKVAFKGSRFLKSVYGKFWIGKKLANLVNRMPFAIFYLPGTSFVISCIYTCCSFANIVPASWFELAHSPIFTPPKFSHVRYSHRMHVCHHVSTSVYNLLLSRHWTGVDCCSEGLQVCHCDAWEDEWREGIYLWSTSVCVCVRLYMKYVDNKYA